VIALSDSDIAFIERLLDKHGVNELLYVIELACLNKADLLEIETQDSSKWVNASNRINHIRGEIADAI
jgi:hypothetical protein